MSQDVLRPNILEYSWLRYYIYYSSFSLTKFVMVDCSDWDSGLPQDASLCLLTWCYHIPTLLILLALLPMLGLGSMTL